MAPGGKIERVRERDTSTQLCSDLPAHTGARTHTHTKESVLLTYVVWSSSEGTVWTGSTDQHHATHTHMQHTLSSLY